jgi:DNA-binding HxlR family transcriptional regulator
MQPEHSEPRKAIRGVRRKSFGKARCPVARSLDTIGDWWTLLLVRDALRGARRFSDFQQSLGLAKNVLSVRLRKLVDDGIMELRPSPSRSDRNEYHLTNKGRRLLVVILALRQWGEQNLFRDGEEMSEMIEADTGSPLQLLRALAQDGRALSPDDISIRIRVK